VPIFGVNNDVDKPQSLKGMKSCHLKHSQS